MSIEKVGLIYDERRAETKPWKVRWFGEFDPTTGKQRRYCRSFARKRDAESFQAELTAKFGDGATRRDPPRVPPLGEFCKQWLQTKQPELRPGTIDRYREVFERLYGYFGKGCRLDQVTARRANLFAARQTTDLRRGHEDRVLSPWTRARIIRSCHAIFEGAKQWEILKNNPFSGVKPPKAAVTRWHYIKPREYRRLLDVAPSLYWKAFYALTYTGGLRLGEAFSLQWDDIDFDTGQVVVQDRPGNDSAPPFYVKDHETRRIPLPTHSLDIIRTLKANSSPNVPYVLLTRERYRRVVEKWRTFRAIKKPWYNRFVINNVLRDMRVHARKAGITANGSLNVHALRKSCGQNWANHLPINVVKELMGHSSISTTQRFYNQVDEDHLRKAARVIDEMVRGGSTVPQEQ